MVGTVPLITMRCTGPRLVTMVLRVVVQVDTHTAKMRVQCCQGSVYLLVRLDPSTVYNPLLLVQPIDVLDNFYHSYKNIAGYCSTAHTAAYLASLCSLMY